ncbi:Alpha-glucosidase [Fusarium oxysporum f. sp. albedinis]|nr:Alpha-glucosidase [Fusarium oxysporum f. sp. albedinis]
MISKIPLYYEMLACSLVPHAALWASQNLSQRHLCCKVPVYLYRDSAIIPIHVRIWERLRFLSRHTTNKSIFNKALSQSISRSSGANNQHQDNDADIHRRFGPDSHEAQHLHRGSCGQ